VNRGPSGHRGDLRNPRLSRVTQIRLGQQDDRGSAALAREQQITFEPPETEVGIERHDDEDDVDIGGHHLFIGDVPGGLTGKAAAPRQDRDDRAAWFAGTAAHDDPVTDSGQFAAEVGLMLEAPGQHRLELAVLHVNAIDMIELDEDTRRLDVGRIRPLAPRGRVGFIPPECVEPHSSSLPCQGRRPRRGAVCATRRSMSA
jgi:hypothetical protein